MSIPPVSRGGYRWVAWTLRFSPEVGEAVFTEQSGLEQGCLCNFMAAVTICSDFGAPKNKV